MSCSTPGEPSKSQSAPKLDCWAARSEEPQVLQIRAVVPPLVTLSGRVGWSLLALDGREEAQVPRLRVLGIGRIALVFVAASVVAIALPRQEMFR